MERIYKVIGRDCGETRSVGVTFREGEMDYMAPALEELGLSYVEMERPLLQKMGYSRELGGTGLKFKLLTFVGTVSRMREFLGGLSQQFDTEKKGTGDFVGGEYDD